MTNAGHYNDPRSTVKQWTFDNAQRHVTTFWPISEAARSGHATIKYDESKVENVAE